MATAFVSYSRRDIEFAKRLTDELQKNELDSWIDWEDIPPTVDWWQEIQKGIEEADVFIFILSPDGVQSQVNAKQLEHAIQNGKRLIPIVARDLTAAEVPAALSRLNWIFMREQDDFEAGVQKVISAIRTDHVWIQFHRQLQVKALEWERKNRDNSYLLRGKALQEAEAQLVAGATKDPAPTDLQRGYVLTSRKNLSFLSRGVEAVGNVFGGGQSGQSQELRQPAVKAKDDDIRKQVGPIAGISASFDSVARPVPKIFISYRRKDSSYIVGRLRDQLQTAFGERSIVSDLEEIPAGADFREFLEREIAQCNFMLVIIGPQWASIADGEGNRRLLEPGDFTRIEVETGLRRRDVVVIPVLVMGASMPATTDLPESLADLAFRNAIALRNDPDFNRDMDRLISAMSQVEKSRSDIPQTSRANSLKERNPYIGPRTFQREEAYLFFGREREASELLALVQAEQLLLFYAQSGAGKSSLINTRLIPNLEANRATVLPVARVSGDPVPGIEGSNIYVSNLIRSLDQHGTDPTVLSRLSLEEFLGHLGSDERGFFYDPAAVNASMVGPRVLIIDQFEEMFIAHPESWEKREDFFRQIAEAMRDDPLLKILLVMREDFIASLDPYAGLLSNGLRARYSMQPLGREAALKAVSSPVQELRPYAPGVAEKLVEDLSSMHVYRPDGTLEVSPGQYVEPVQLQVVCYSLWENLSPEGNEIVEGDLKDVGDLNESLSRYFDQRVREVSQRQQVSERSIREWFVKYLISAGGIRNLILREPVKSSGLDNSVIDALQSDIVHAEKRGGATWYELAHDRLVEPILESNRRWFQLNLESLQRLAALWNDQGRNASWLLTGRALADGQAWANEHQDELTELENAFLEASWEKAYLEEGPVTANLTDDDQPIMVADEAEPEMSEDERSRRRQAAIAANILTHNRSQAVFNDRAQGEDQLGIKDEVEALAETLLLRDVEPPVAVGVMGGWGSGKSFVMYLISRYVEETRTRAIKKGWPAKDKDDDVPVYVGHIYQINFNAWTYAKSNLWASLMDTIFSCLNRQMQLERLFAHQEIEAKDLPTSEWNQEQKDGFKARVLEGMLKGGALFKKIYQEDYQISLDPDLAAEPRERLTFWSERLLNHNLLWQVLRNQNEQALEKIREDEKELEKDKARRDALDQTRQTEEVSSVVLDKRIVEPAYFALLQETLLRFLADAAHATIDQELKNQKINKKDLLDLEKNAEKAVKGTQGIIHACRQSRYYWISGLSIAALTFALPYLWAQFGQPAINEFITRGISLVTAIAPIIPTILARWQKIVDFELETKAAFEKGYEAQQSRRAEEIAAENSPFEEKVRKLKEEIEKGSLPASNVLIRLKENQIEEQRLRIGPAAKYSNLLEFVQSRLDAATYENQLGLMHQVRRDIDELTYSLVNSANKDIFPRGKPRVILYIDDLDRCPPSRVVEILEAVQLLLNTKLFVVILGLDTRYVTRALEKEYKEILQHEGDPSGLDYIEKIIQIPYRVRPIERDSLQKYLAMQMDVEKAPEPEPEVQHGSQLQEEPVPAISSMETLKPGAVQPQIPQAETPMQAPTSTDGQMPVATAEQVQALVVPQETNAAQQTPASVHEPQTDPLEQASKPADTGRAEPVEQTTIPANGEQQPESSEQMPSFVEQGKPEISEKQPGPETKSEEIKPLVIELPPAVIQFKREDLLDLTTCCQQISLSPRSIKRLVNVFKLMKIFWFRADKEAGLAERDRPRPVKQAAMCLLALSSAYPEVMREVFVHLEGLYRQGQDHTRLLAALSNIKLPPGSASELAWQLQRYKGDVSTLKSMPGDSQGSLDQITLGQLKFSTFNITRSFSFVGDPVYWTDDEEEKIRANGHVSVKRVAKVNRN